VRSSSRVTRHVVAAGVAVALVATGSAAWAIWSIRGSGNGPLNTASIVELSLTARPDSDLPLYPGLTTAVRVTVRNDNAFPIRVTAVEVGAGPTIVDPSHRDAGCTNASVSLVGQGFSVRWRVPANSSRTFVISNAIRMASNSPNACQGASFTIPLVASGSSDAA
jgi:hypothetical protein